MSKGEYSSVFEVKATDLAGRIGRLRTKSGVVETPALLPVIHPLYQTVSPDFIRKIGFSAVMTNAYIAMKSGGEAVRKNGIHRTIGFDGTVMTDSGGYQVLEYGDVDVSPESMARFEEEIGSDIAVVLDKPTGSQTSRWYAEETVQETLRRDERTLAVKSRRDMLWTGPVQGGIHLDLVEQSARETGKLGFDVYALGSPTVVMEAYKFRLLAAMIVAAKRNLPMEQPFHLFGAGHPLTIPLAVALGCDLFDSASYILYAREDRYLTDTGTVKLKDLSYLSCSCPVCTSTSLDELRRLPDHERCDSIAVHNLYLLKKSVDECKEAIREGRLWEHLGSKARCHPRLWEAFQTLTQYNDLLEEGTALYQSKGVFFIDATDENRPQVRRHRRRIVNDVEFHKPMLILLPEPDVRPSVKSQLYNSIVKVLGEASREVQVCFLIHPYGLVPVEISDIYPLAQYESAIRPDAATPSPEVVEEIKRVVVGQGRFSRVVVLVDGAYSRGVAEGLRGTTDVRVVTTVEDPADAAETVVSTLRDGNTG
ncbi:MAG: tRNA guanosine(15) transglycosylase TgtA [Thaumarchaeota archaeon]|nr:tRNA guanosine(15) transglycosylase TgtA [Nitrososphaerota archaeon]